MFEIHVRGLHHYGFHGCSVEEQKLGHRFTFDVDLWVEGAADTTDSIADTVCYGSVAQVVTDVSAERSRSTVEKLAREVAEALLAKFELTVRVRVTVEKLAPPFPLIVDAVGVTVEQSRV